MRLQRILVTTDFSEAARTAYPVAEEIVNRFGAEAYLVHVLEDLPPFSYHRVERVPEDPNSTLGRFVTRRL
ncbi:MAG: universal stress protein, partial [Planctomycetota bacterium]